MLLAITPNPTIDRTLTVPKMKVGMVHRAKAVHLAAGGKGLNVTRVALTLGVEVLATGPLAGHAGRMVADLAEAEGLPAEWYWLNDGETRTCLLLNHDGIDATVVNEPGRPLSPQDWQGLAGHLTRLGQKAQAITFSGSLPPGVDGDAFAALARSLATSDRAVYVDTSGPALAAVLTQPEGLCLKVNQAELAVGLKLRLETIDRIIHAGHGLVSQGAALVVVTMGGAGAMTITPKGSWHITAPPVQVVSTVGSGDSFLAGLAVARMQGQTVREALKMGILCGSANVTTALPGRFERATLEGLRQGITLTEMA